jgi:putative NIF3 family GTP cyclohydrolase 1 type 2
VLHTALDCASGGLNDLWCEALGLESVKPITGNLGWVGRIARMPFAHLEARVQAYAGGVEGQVVSPNRAVSSVVLCTGLGGWIADEALATGADVYVTGELVQPADSLGFFGVIEVGHTRSERVGVTAIQRVLGPDVHVDVAPLEIDRWVGEVFGGRRVA